MIEENYSRKRAKQLSKEIGDPEEMLENLILADPKSKYRIENWRNNNQWKNIQSVEEVNRRLNQFESIVNSDKEYTYIQMLLLYRNVYMGIKKLNTLDPEMPEKEIDTYITRLTDTFNKMMEKKQMQDMKDD